MTYDHRQTSAGGSFYFTNYSQPAMLGLAARGLGFGLEPCGIVNITENDAAHIVGN